MAIEIVDFPIENCGSFHSYVNVYQRVIEFHQTFERLNRCFLGLVFAPPQKKIDSKTDALRINALHILARLRTTARWPFWQLFQWNQVELRSCLFAWVRFSHSILDGATSLLQSRFLRGSASLFHPN